MLKKFKFEIKFIYTFDTKYYLVILIVIKTKSEFD
jgi:hypothetical protein